MFFLNRIRRWLSDRQRQIFYYRDGSGWRRGDPVCIGTHLERICPDYQGQLLILRQQIGEIPAGPMRDDALAQQKAAVEKLVTAARAVFGLQPLTQTDGVTDAEAVATLTAYFLFMEQLAGEAELFRDSPGLGSPSPAAFPTASSPDSGTAAAVSAPP